MANIVWYDNEKMWRCQVTKNGKTKSFKSHKVGSAGKREVQAKVRAFMSDGVYSDPTIEKEFNKFLEDVAARSSASNYRNLAQLGRLYILPVIGNRKFSTIRITDLQRVINNSKKQDGTMLSKKSYSNIKNCISSFFHYARLDGVTELITTDLYVPKTAVKGTKNVLNTEQVKLLFTDFEDEFYINLWRFMVCTGTRPSEALGLKWSDIEGFYIKIQRGVNYHHEITDCKNSNARRVIPVNSLLQEILENQKAKTAYLNSEWVFPSPSGDMPYQTTTKNSIKRISEKLGVNVSAYCLRHTFVSLMKNDVPESYIKQIIGHSTSMPTYSGTYSHALNGEKETAAAMIDDTLRRIL